MYIQIGDVYATQRPVIPAAYTEAGNATDSSAAWPGHSQPLFSRGFVLIRSLTQITSFAFDSGRFRSQLLVLES